MGGGVMENTKERSDDMSMQPEGVSRRQFLRYAGGTAMAAAALGAGGGIVRNLLRPEAAYALPPGTQDGADLYFGGTDGWIHLPAEPAIGNFHPDDLAPGDFNNYIFGFRDITDLSPVDAAAQKMKAQHSAPLFWVNEYDGTNEFRLQLTNLGLALRPDLIDAHTLHWHGFRNMIPFFDGEPSGSASVPIESNFVYVYRPRDPGTYMYHCHVEDVEHVHMGMTGMVFVRPAQDGNTALYPSGKFLYNDGNGSTGYDREFAMFLSEVWAEAHWADSHIQLPEWSDYRPDFSLLNGRVYPDTVLPNAELDLARSISSLATARTADGELVAPLDASDVPISRLQYQPYSSLVTCNAGERVALRFANLGFMQAAMTIPGIKMRVVGTDATPAVGRDGTDLSHETNTISFGAGESHDVIFTAPAYDAAADAGSGYNRYLLYNRALQRSGNLAGDGYGGQTTEIHVYPAGTLLPQGLPNTNPGEQL